MPGSVLGREACGCGGAGAWAADGECVLRRAWAWKVLTIGCRMVGGLCRPGA